MANSFSTKSFNVILIVLLVKTDVVDTRQNSSVILRDWLKGCADVNFQCSQDKRHFCKCDELCNNYNDCCYDAPMSERLGRTTELDGFISLSTCNPVQSASARTRAVFMVSKCPSSWVEDDIREKCEKEIQVTLSEMMPVLDKNTFLTFRNQYCAMCNGLSDWIGWDLQLFFNWRTVFNQNLAFTDMVFQMIKSGACSFSIKSPYPEFARTCSLKIERSSRLLEEVNACSSGILEPIRIKTTTETVFARNRNCAENWLFNINETKINSITCWSETGTQTSFFALSAILHFSSLTEESGTKQCEEKTIFMSDKDGCHELFCPVGSHPHYGHCISNGIGIGFVLDILLEVNTRNEGFWHFIYKRLTSMIKKDIFEFSNVFMHSYQYNFTIFDGIDSLTGNSCSFLHINMPLILSENSPEQNIDWKAVRQRAIQTLQNCSFLVEDNIRAACIAGLDNRTCLSNSTIANSKYLLPIITTYYERNLPCAAVEVNLVRINDTSNHTSDDGSAVYILKSTTTRINASHIVRVGNEFYLCIDTYLEFYKSPHPQLTTFVTYARFLTNICCSCISIISTLCLLCHYYKNILGTRISAPIVVLLVVLFVEQCQFMLISILPNIGDMQICLWLASLHHFTWISTFSFMFISLTRLYADITSLKNVTDRACVRNIRYSVFGFATPSVITFCTKLSEMIIKPTELWYGGKFCFIKHRSVLLYTFVIPMVLFLFANIVVFCLIIYYIKKTTSRIRHSNNVCIYLRISSTLGFTWIIGVINGFFGHELLAWIFEITTNLQGFAIMLGFLCNKRTFLVYKETLFPPKRHHTIVSVGSVTKNLD